MSKALTILEAKPCFDGPEHKLELQVAAQNDAFWYDLADPAWRAVKVTGDNWKMVDRPPILFRRYRNTATQVEPARGGDVWPVLKFGNLSSDQERLLLVAYLVTCLIPGIPHPLPVAHGENSAAKSTFRRVIQRLVDPSVEELFPLPADTNELALEVAHNHMPCYDNLDNLKQWQSNILCTVATGGGIAKR